jgi:hypothetical protein
MRVAFIGGGETVESIDLQIARLQPLHPDRYQIEETISGPARQRLVELLDALNPGDELCLASLAALGMTPAEVTRVASDLLAKKVRLTVITEAGTRLELDSEVARALLQALADLSRKADSAPPRAGAQTPPLLSEDEIADIRRLSRAGLSARKIGLIYRRSPRCISDILWSRSQDTV